MRSSLGMVALSLLAVFAATGEADEATARTRLKELGAVITTGDNPSAAVAINLNVSRTTDGDLRVLK